MHDPKKEEEMLAWLPAASRQEAWVLFDPASSRLRMTERGYQAIWKNQHLWMGALLQ